MLSRRAMMNDEIVSEQGNNLALQKCKGSYLHGMKVYGHTTQETTTGAQLLDIRTISTGIKYGIDISVNDKQYLVCDGTISDLNATLLSLDVTDIIAKEKNVYAFADIIDGVFEEVIRINIMSADGSVLKRVALPAVFDYVDGNRYNLLVMTNMNVIRDVNCELAIQINKGSAPLPWEPYTGGIPSPSPDYPQELASAGDKGNIGVDVYGKNILKYESFNVESCKYKINENVITCTSSQAFSHIFYYIPKYLWDKDIRLTARQLDQFARTQIAVYDKDNNQKSVVLFNGVGEIDRIVNFRDYIDENTRSVRLKLYASTANTILEQERSVTYYDVMLTLSDDSAYELPINIQPLTMLTPNGLPGIPVSSGGNYTDENGQQWIADEIDWERGVYVQRVNKIMIDGDNNKLLYYGQFGVDNAPLYYINTKNRDDSKNLGLVISTHYRTFSTGIENMPNQAMRKGNENDRIYIRDDTFLGVDEFNAWLTNNPIEVLYVLNNFVETSIPAEELAAYHALHTNTPTTTIVNNEDCWMEVTHRRLRG